MQLIRWADNGMASPGRAPSRRMCERRDQNEGAEHPKPTSSVAMFVMSTVSSPGPRCRRAAAACAARERPRTRGSRPPLRSGRASARCSNPRAAPARSQSAAIRVRPRGRERPGGRGVLESDRALRNEELRKRPRMGLLRRQSVWPRRLHPSEPGWARVRRPQRLSSSVTRLSRTDHDKRRCLPDLKGS